MKLEKEQRTQFIVLCVLVAVVIGFGGYRLIGTGTSANSPAASPKPAAAAEKSGQPTAGSAEQPSAAQDMAKAMGFVLPVQDPFEPKDVPSTEVRPKPVVTTSVPRLPLIARESRMPLPVMPAFESQPIGMTPAPVIEQVDPSRDYRLTGVIEGDSNIAIIRGPQDSRHIIREGQSLDGRFVVRSITRAGVRLSYNGRNYFLMLSAGSAKGA
jgi:hypothetical protein